ncbi:galactose-binding domain-like protein [Panaeolus papilionaceus]|nr:galactose-binding domain-like protein [Panaeolus papilionaceus]
MTIGGELVSLVDQNTSIKVSSTLEKANGKKNLVDNNPETCWRSQQGLPQFIQLGFNNQVIPKRISITFQGGFVGTRCSLSIPPTANQDGSMKKEWSVVTHIYPKDVNRKQSFDLVMAESSLPERGVSALRLVFEESSDFFGRITIYDLTLEGTKVE